MLPKKNSIVKYKRKKNSIRLAEKKRLRNSNVHS